MFAFSVFQNSFISSAPVYDDSSGKSGAKFLKSSDGKFIVKTITREEVELMHNILPDYHKVMEWTGLEKDQNFYRLFCF